MNYTYPYKLTQLYLEMENDLKKLFGYTGDPVTSEFFQNKRFLKELVSKYGRTLVQMEEKTGIFRPSYFSDPNARAFLKQKQENDLRVERSASKAIKAIYEVSDLYFATEGMTAFNLELNQAICTRKQIVECSYAQLKIVLKMLSGEVSRPPYWNGILFKETGLYYKTLDSLREDNFILRLSGV